MLRGQKTEIDYVEKHFGEGTYFMQMLQIASLGCKVVPMYTTAGGGLHFEFEEYGVRITNKDGKSELVPYPQRTEPPHTEG